MSQLQSEEQPSPGSMPSPCEGAAPGARRQRTRHRGTESGEERGQGPGEQERPGGSRNQGESVNGRKHDKGRHTSINDEVSYFQRGPALGKMTTCKDVSVVPLGGGLGGGGADLREGSERTCLQGEVEQRQQGLSDQEWSDGSRYEGEFVNGLKHGKGKYIWMNGEYYEGSFYKDYRHGDGLYCWPSGHKFTGKFYLNKKEGYGQQLFPNGAVFQGLYHAGQRFGPGVVTHPDGHQDVGLWVGEQLIRLCTTLEEGFTLKRFPEYAAYVDPAAIPDSLSQQPLLLSEQKNVRTHCELHAYSDLPIDESFIYPHGMESYSTDGDFLPLPPGRRRELDQHFFGELWEPDVYQGYERDPLATLPLQVRMRAHIHKHRLLAQNLSWDVAAVLSLNRESFGPKGPLEVDSEHFIQHASRGDVKALWQMRKSGLIHPDVADSLGDTALIAATVNCRNDVIHLLLDMGADIDKLNCEGMSALAVCCVLYYPIQSLLTDLAKKTPTTQVLRCPSLCGSKPRNSQLDFSTDTPELLNRPQSPNLTLRNLSDQTAEDLTRVISHCSSELSNVSELTTECGPDLIEPETREETEGEGKLQAIEEISYSEDESKASKKETVEERELTCESENYVKGKENIVESREEDVKLKEEVEENDFDSREEDVKLKEEDEEDVESREEVEEDVKLKEEDKEDVESREQVEEDVKLKEEDKEDEEVEEDDAESGEVDVSLNEEVEEDGVVSKEEVEEDGVVSKEEVEEDGVVSKEEVEEDNAELGEVDVSLKEEVEEDGVESKEEVEDDDVESREEVVNLEDDVKEDDAESREKDVNLEEEVEEYDLESREEDVNLEEEVEEDDVESTEEDVTLEEEVEENDVEPAEEAVNLEEEVEEDYLDLREDDVHFEEEIGENDVDSREDDANLEEEVEEDDVESREDDANLEEEVEEDGVESREEDVMLEDEFQEEDVVKMEEEFQEDDVGSEEEDVKLDEEFQEEEDVKLEEEFQEDGVESEEEDVKLDEEFQEDDVESGEEDIYLKEDIGDDYVESREEDVHFEEEVEEDDDESREEDVSLKEEVEEDEFESREEHVNSEEEVEKEDVELNEEDISLEEDVESREDVDLEEEAEEDNVESRKEVILEEGVEEDIVESRKDENLEEEVEEDNVESRKEVILEEGVEEDNIELRKEVILEEGVEEDNFELRKEVILEEGVEEDNVELRKDVILEEGVEEDNVESRNYVNLEEEVEEDNVESRKEVILEEGVEEDNVESRKDVHLEEEVEEDNVESRKEVILEEGVEEDNVESRKDENLEEEFEEKDVEPRKDVPLEEEVEEGDVESMEEDVKLKEEVEVDVEKKVGDIPKEYEEARGSEDGSIQASDNHTALGSLQYDECMTEAGAIAQPDKEQNQESTFDSACSVSSITTQVSQETMPHAAEAPRPTGIPQSSDAVESIPKMAPMEIKRRVRLDTLTLLMDRGADPNVSTVPMPPIFLAIMAADTVAVRKLLQCGARTDIALPPEKKGLYPLHVAAALPGSAGPTITELLLHAITDPDVQACDQEEIYEPDRAFMMAHEPGGRTALHIACQRDRDYKNASKVVAHLLSHSARTDLLWSGHSPLSLAIASGNELAVEELLKGGADPNIPLGRGVGSALCALVNINYNLCGNRLHLLDILAKAGANIMMPIAVGDFVGTAVDYAHYSFSQDLRIANIPFHTLNMEERETFIARRRLLSMMGELMRQAGVQREKEKLEKEKQLSLSGHSETDEDVPTVAIAISSIRPQDDWESQPYFTDTATYFTGIIRKPSGKFCYHCGRSTFVYLTACTRCYKVFYCSDNCKQKAWDERHKEECHVTRVSASAATTEKKKISKSPKHSKALNTEEKVSEKMEKQVSNLSKSQKCSEELHTEENVLETTEEEVSKSQKHSKALNTDKQGKMKENYSCN